MDINDVKDLVDTVLAVVADTPEDRREEEAVKSLLSFVKTAQLMRYNPVVLSSYMNRTGLDGVLDMPLEDVPKLIGRYNERELGGIIIKWRLTKGM